MVIRRKTLLWFVIVWFAILQTIAPFIHAHLEEDAPGQPHGLHVHGIAAMPDSEHTLKNVTLPVHVIGVNQAVVKSLDLLPLPIFALLFVTSLSLLFIRFNSFCHLTHFLLPQYLRSLLRPRAPPHP